MITSLCTFSRNADNQNRTQNFIWVKFTPWEYTLRSCKLSILSPLYTRNKTLEQVLVGIHPSGYAWRNFETLDLNPGKHERTH